MSIPSKDPRGRGQGNRRIHPEVLDFVARQVAMLQRTIEIDEQVWGCPPDRLSGYRDLTDRAGKLRQLAQRELFDALRSHAADPAERSLFSVSLLASAFAQSNFGSPAEDEVLSYAVSHILERFVTSCQTVEIRDRIEDLVNIAHRRAALTRQPRPTRQGRPDGAWSGGSEVPADEPEPAFDIFGFPSP